MSPKSPAPRWRSAPADAIAWREWEGEFVVRNERTGNTHLLAPLAGKILQLLLDAGGGLAVADVAAALSSEWPDAFGHSADPMDVRAAIESVLAEFRRLELAEAEQE